MLQLAQQHFGRKKNERTRPVLQQATLNGIQLKRQMLDMMRKQDFDDPLLQSEMKTIESIIRPMVLHDQQQWYAEWLDGINEAGAQYDTALVYKKLQRLGRRKKSLDKGPRPLPRLKVADDKYAQSFEACQEIWRNQFAEIEAGIQVTDVQLVQLHKQSVAQGTREARFCPTHVKSFQFSGSAKMERSQVLGNSRLTSSKLEEHRWQNSSRHYW